MEIDVVEELTELTKQQAELIKRLYAILSQYITIDELDEICANCTFTN